MSDELTQAKERVSESLAGAVKDLKELFESKPRRVAKYVGKTNTYYDEKYARQIYPHILAIKEDKKPRLFKYDSFPSKSRNTLYQFLFYARKYLEDELVNKLYPNEAERKEFLQFLSYIGFRRIGLGIVIELTSLPSGIKSEIYDGESADDVDKIKIRRAVDNYLESGAVGTPLKMRDIKLNSEDIEEYNVILSTYPNLLFNVTRDSIALMKVTEEEYNKVK